MTVIKQLSSCSASPVQHCILIAKINTLRSLTYLRTPESYHLMHAFGLTIAASPLITKLLVWTPGHNDRTNATSKDSLKQAGLQDVVYIYSIKNMCKKCQTYRSLFQVCHANLHTIQNETWSNKKLACCLLTCCHVKLITITSSWCNLLSAIVNRHNLVNTAAALTSWTVNTYSMQRCMALKFMMLTTRICFCDFFCCSSLSTNWLLYTICC